MSAHRNKVHPLFERLENRSLMSATLFDQTNLVSDQFGVAQIQDKQLINPWAPRSIPQPAYSGYRPTTPGSRNSLAAT